MSNEGSAESAKKEQITTHFDQIAHTYDHVGPQRFVRLGRRLVELAEIPTGAKVLDIATGRGAVLIPAAEQVGPTGRAVGVDLSEAMVRETASQISRLNLMNAEIRRMDAEQLEFPDAYFDRVLCGFALFFFPQLDRALSEFRRVLKPGGRIVVSTWGNAKEGWQWYDELLAAYGLSKKTLTTQALDELSDLETVLRRAGFIDVQPRAEDFDFIYADEEEWWSQFCVHGGRIDLAELEPDALERFKADAFIRIQAFRQSESIHRPVRVLFASATESQL